MTSSAVNPEAVRDADDALIAVVARVLPRPRHSGVMSVSVRLQG
jgi:hypothetical protein